MNTGSISSLPSIIVKVKSTFENALYPAKLAYGPTASNAGPTLEMQANAAEKLLKNPCFTVYVPASDTIVMTSPLTESKDSKNIAAIKRKK